jgi:hypothetical protein
MYTCEPGKQLERAPERLQIYLGNFVRVPNTFVPVLLSSQSPLRGNIASQVSNAWKRFVGVPKTETSIRLWMRVVHSLGMDIIRLIECIEYDLI